MKHTVRIQEPVCPVARTARLVGDEWTILIVRDLLKGPQRFSHFQTSLSGVSPKTLSHRLRMLEQAGIINRTAYAEIPPRVEYSLTERGRALSGVLNAMRAFGESYLLDAAAD